MKKRTFPMLSTHFSNSGQKAAGRFENILGSKKTKGVFLPTFLFSTIICIEFLISCGAEKANEIGIIGGADEKTGIIITSGSQNTRPLVTAFIPYGTDLYYDKNMLYSIKRVVADDELRDMYMPVQLLYNDGVQAYVSIPTEPGAEGFVSAGKLQFDIPELCIFTGNDAFTSDMERVDLSDRTGTLVIKHRSSGNLVSATPIGTDDIYLYNEADLSNDAFVLSEKTNSSLYPAVYNYLEDEFINHCSDEYDNCMITKLSTLGRPVTYDDNSGCYEYTVQFNVTYTEKYDDPKILSYIDEALESGDYNYLTYYDGEEIFRHGLIPMIKLKFKLNSSGEIDKSTVVMYENIGQVIVTMPVPDPYEEWAEIENIGALFPAGMHGVTYSKELTDPEMIRYIG